MSLAAHPAAFGNVARVVFSSSVVISTLRQSFFKTRAKLTKALQPFLSVSCQPRTAAPQVFVVVVYFVLMTTDPVGVYENLPRVCERYLRYKVLAWKHCQPS